jgi:hypothetical protein
LGKNSIHYSLHSLGLIDDYAEKETKIAEIRGKLLQDLQERGISTITVDTRTAKEEVARYFDQQCKADNVPGADKDRYRKGARVLRDDYNEDND